MITLSQYKTASFLAENNTVSNLPHTYLCCICTEVCVQLVTYWLKDMLILIHQFGFNLGKVLI